jgi:hypothetical protein
VGNTNSDSVVTKGNISKCDDVSSVPCMHMEKENVDSPSMPKSSTKTEIVGVKASRVNCFASDVVVSNRVNDSQRVLLSFKDSFEMSRSEQLGEALQISVPMKTCVNKLEFHRYDDHISKSQRKYRHLQRHNPLYKNSRQNFRGGTYTKKNEGRKQIQGMLSNCMYCK